MSECTGSPNSIEIDRKHRVKVWLIFDDDDDGDGNDADDCDDLEYEVMMKVNELQATWANM